MALLTVAARLGGAHFCSVDELCYCRFGRAFIYVRWHLSYRARLFPLV